MAGSRQHYIPQFLLRRFADSTGAVKVIQSGGKAFTTGTRSVAVGRDFYGPPGQGTTDDVLTSAESGIHVIVREMVASAAGVVPATPAATLFAHFSVRTASWRSQLRSSLTEAVTQVGKRIQGAADTHPLVTAAVATAIQNAIRIGHERTLTAQLDLLRQNPVPRDAVRAFSSWNYILWDFETRLVLPDTIAIAVSMRDVGVPLMGRDDTTKAILLPLSTTRCLAGFPHSAISMSAADFNGFAFDASDSFVVAHPDWHVSPELMDRFAAGTSVFIEQIGEKFRAGRGGGGP